MSGDNSFLELRFYIVLMFIVIFSFTGIVMIGLGGTGVFLGITLLLSMIGIWILIYYSHKIWRCPNCSRIVLASSFRGCPFCGKVLKDKR